MRVHHKEGLLGEGKVHRFEIPSADGLTARKVIGIVRDGVARETGKVQVRPLGIAVNGRLLREPELDLQLPDGAEIVVASPQQGTEVLVFIGNIILTAVIGAALGYVVMLLFPPPRPRGLQQDRGDDTSATYAWDGINTSYGQGQPVAIVSGRMAVGGQVIYTRVDTAVNGSDEFLLMILALSEGPIYRIGDTFANAVLQLGAEQGPGPLNPPLPSTLYLNGVQQQTLAQTDVTAWLRPGTLNQPVLPSTTTTAKSAFPDTATSFLVNAPIDDVDSEAIFAFEGTDAVGQVQFVIAYPFGLYAQNASGGIGAVSVRLDYYWRPDGQATWNALGSANGSVQLVGYKAFTNTFAIGGPDGVNGPLEFRVVRRAPSFTFGTQVGNIVWRHAIVSNPNRFSYPGTALLGLRMRANGQNRGTLPQVQVRVDGILVRVWDESVGFSDPCWDVPAAPFDWMDNPPGRNPAWIALEWCTNEFWGLGRWLKVEQIDLPSLRRWSILCDQEPNAGDPWNEPAFTCDFVADAPRPAWERLLAICQAGRCSPMWIGGKLTFVYQYRDAHADGLVSVPAKAPVQLFTTTNIEDFSIQWLQRRGRSNLIVYQFLNEAKNYAQDVLPVPDVEVALDDPLDPTAEDLNPETVQVYSVTRPSQLLREGVFTHRLTRLTSHKISFRTGPWALAATVGDLIDVENEVLRPFGDDQPMSCVIEADGVATASMIVGHVVTGSSLRVVFRAPDGKPKQATINSLTSLPGGRTQLNLATSETFGAGAPAVIGKVAKITKTYLIVAISLSQDLKREVEAIEWVPAAFDPIGPNFFSEPAETFTAPAELRSSALVSIDAQRGGGHVLGWISEGQRTSRARVWMRSEGVDQWFLLGESTTGALETKALAPHLNYEIAVCFDQGRGAYVSPEAVDASTITAPEFPRQLLPKVARLTIEDAGAGLRFRWPAYGHTDLAYYELRVGSTWVTARPVYRGQLEEVVLDPPPAGSTFQVAVRSTSGLYGEPAVATAPAWTPPDKEAFVEVDELVSTPAGAITNLTYNATPKTLTLTAAQGEYEALELDGGYVAPWEWRVEHDYTIVDNLTCGEETGLCGDGDARWATCACRPPSPGRPGVAFDDVLVGDDTGLCGDDSPFEACGGTGELGDLAVARLESRTHDGSTWGDWQAHADGVQVATQKLQVRVRTERQSERVSVEINKLVSKGFL